MVGETSHLKRERPTVVTTAMWLMLAGAGVALFEMVMLARNSDELLLRYFISLTPEPGPIDDPTLIYPPWIISLDALGDLMAAVVVGLALIVVVCCVWLALMTSQGRNWARILATVLAIGFIITWTAMLTAAATMNLADMTFWTVATAGLPYCVAVPATILLWAPRGFFTK